MKYFDWSKEKNLWLKQKRGVSFEDVTNALDEGRELARIEHPNKKRYPRQKIIIVSIENYVYGVPFVEDEEKIFLKTIYPSRKLNKQFKEEQTNEK